MEPFKLELGEGCSLLMKSFDKFGEWLETERDYIQSIIDIQQRYTSNTYQSLIGQIKQALNDIDTVVTETRLTKGPPQIIRMKDAISDVYRNNRLIYSASPRGEFAQKYFQNSPAVAIGILAQWIYPKGIRIQDDGIISGMIHAITYDLYLSSNLAGEKKSLVQLREDWNKTFSEEQNIINQSSKIAQKTREKYETFKKDKENDIENFIKEKTKLIESLRNNTQQALESITNTTEDGLKTLKISYEQELGLRKPVEYWEARKTYHEENITLWPTGLSFLATIVVGVTYFFKSVMLDNKIENTEIAVLFIIGGLGVWVTRFFQRLYLSHLHLRTDAEERVTMMQAFLALSTNKETLNGLDRSQIMDALFRSSNYGLIKDDSNPSMLLEIFNKFRPK